MNPSEIKKALYEIGGGANKSLGQHFLIDPQALRTIVQTANVKNGDVVLEVGPGLGVLTEALTEQGAEVIAIERDRRFIPRLEAMKNVRVIQGDAALLHWHELVGDAPWKFISNLPYQITSLALRKSLWTPKPPSTVVVLVQREVAERAISKDGKTSLLSLMVSLASSEARIVRRVPAGAFYPPPKVESAVLEIIPMDLKEREKHWGIDPECVMRLAKKGFAHPRKLLASNLGLHDKSVLAEIGAGEKARAEELTTQQWVELTKRLDVG